MTIFNEELDADRQLLLISYETITDLMTLQDQIETFQKLIFAHFRGSNNNECRISALVPLVKESYGIYRFITSMMRAMHRSLSEYFPSGGLEYKKLMSSDLHRDGVYGCAPTAERPIQRSALQLAQVLLRMLKFEIPYRSHKCTKVGPGENRYFLSKIVPDSQLHCHFSTGTTQLARNGRICSEHP